MCPHQPPLPAIMRTRPGDCSNIKHNIQYIAGKCLKAVNNKIDEIFDELYI